MIWMRLLMINVGVMKNILKLGFTQTGNKHYPKGLCIVSKQENSLNLANFKRHLATNHPALTEHNVKLLL